MEGSPTPSKEGNYRDLIQPCLSAPSVDGSCSCQGGWSRQQRVAGSSVVCEEGCGRFVSQSTSAREVSLGPAADHIPEGQDPVAGSDWLKLLSCASCWV